MHVRLDEDKRELDEKLEDISCAQRFNRSCFLDPLSSWQGVLQPVLFVGGTIHACR
jgi:hypothetical protein